MTQEQECILADLESFHQNQLKELAAKRAGNSKEHQPQEIITDGMVNVKINAARKELVISWK
jgi:hypothetical protein